MLKRLVCCALCMIAFAVAGCRSKGTDTFLILPDTELKTKNVGAGTSAASLHLMKVSMPSYLHRREIVRIVDGDLVTTVPQCRWAVDFERSAYDVLNRNLQVLLGDRYDRWNTTSRQFILDFSRFELDDDDMLNVEGICREAGSQRRLDIRFQLDADDYDNPARAHGAALSKVAVLLGDWLSK